MKAFISHNKADKTTARAFAVLLVEQGADVWFDEWNIQPGDSITGGIQEGIANADVFVLLWSAAASRSNWVGAEVGASLHRRSSDAGIRIVPLMLDGTQLPVLVADYRGFDVSAGASLEDIAAELLGRPRDIELAMLLQRKLLRLTEQNARTGDPFPYLVCPNCGADAFRRSTEVDMRHDDTYYIITCEACGWSDWTQ